MVLAAMIVSFFCSVSAFAQAAGPMQSISATTSKGSFTWTIELASDNDSRSKGLMFRKEMARDRGMLFRFDETQPVSMWMKNTFIPLDMIFLDETGTVFSIHRSAVPHSEEIISSGGPVRYTLELNAGEVERTGIAAGDRLQHPWFAPAN